MTLESISSAQRLRDIKARFVGSLPKLADAAVAHWRVLSAGWDVEAATQLQIFAHRLSGAGASFGFPEISKAARPVDIALLDLLRAHDMPDVGAVNALAKSFQALLSIVRAAGGSAIDAEEIAEKVTPAEEPGKLVMVIDDDELLRLRLAVLFDQAGYRVVTAGDPAVAAALLEKETPAIVLLDLMFPGRDRPAFDVVQDIRDITGERTPVAIVTGRADFSSRIEAVRSGADRFLEKPLDHVHLLKTVAELARMDTSSGLRCLVIDDDVALAERTVALLETSGITADAISEPEDSLSKIAAFRPDVIVLDVNMPRFNGIELAAVLRQEAETALLPIIFLTAESDAKTHQDAIAAGADDFLAKPVADAVLINSVKARVKLARRMQTQVSRVTQRTQTSNALSRHFFFSELERDIGRADEGTKRIALVLLGLTETPAVQEHYGPQGQAAVQEQWLARIHALGLKQWSMLGENTVGILLSREDVAKQMEGIRGVMAQLSDQPFRLQAKDGKKEVASGVCAAAVHLGKSESTLSAVLVQAEQLLSMAFASGPGTVKEGFAGHSGAEAADSGGVMPVDKLRAMYQPIVTIDGIGSPVNFVLARIAGKDGNLLSPERFLPVLEKRGWIPDLDAWAFQHAHQTLTEKIDAQASLFLVVHASSQSLSSSTYLDAVTSLIAATPMRSANQCIVVAVEESAGVTHRGAVAQLAAALQKGGGAMMVTHFGATANSLSVLEYLQPLFVRLEGALARRLEKSATTQPADKVLLDAALAANVGVVASGIEDARSLYALWAKGVRRFQGYFIQEPGSELGNQEQSA
tara:strand:- start:24706 stop:27138 length:2433 start_codon:yes stop_codon:yes gene_type:complete